MPSGSQMSASQSMTQSMTQAEKAAQNMDPAEQEKRLNDLVQYLLIMDQKKIPIKKIGNHNMLHPLYSIALQSFVW